LIICALLTCRHIFISRKEVGFSQAFHIEKDVHSYVNVLKPNSTHESYNNMTHNTQQWTVENLKCVALQLFDTPGNVVLFCNNGRSRSPMYLVAYLVIFHGLLVSSATTLIRDLLFVSRGLDLDRFNSLLPAIERIYDNN